MMMLLPKSIQKNIPPLYSTKDQTDPLCHIKLFTPDSNWTWYIIEFSQEDSDTCYGYVEGLENELGYFSLQEILSLRGALGLKVERDTLFEPTPFSKIKTQKK